MAARLIKAANAFVSASSFIVSSLRGKPFISGLPVAVSFELTNHCNLRCPECASGSGLMKRERGFMDIALFKKVVSELNPYLYYINLFFQGEPMMHPDFFLFPEHTSHIYTVVSSNGHFLSVENSERLAVSGLKKLIVSLDGMSQTIYSEYRRNGEFGKVITGIRNIAAARDKYHSSLKLELQYLISKNNEHQIKEAEHFAKEVGAQLKFKSMQVLSDNDIEKWMPVGEKYRRYKKINGNYVIKNSMPDRCMRLWFNPVITWDGKVIPCCFDKDAEHVMGDLNKDTFRAIWNNSAYSEFRKLVFTHRKTIPICRNCTSGMNREIIR
jgi:radical SAM protein with 4Fe4S-binding SPASM domain